VASGVAQMTWHRIVDLWLLVLAAVAMMVNAAR
jgi:hypothetical protein